MKLAIGILACLMGLPGAVWAQSTLVFPRLYPLAELRNTGFAIVNPGPANATVAFSLFSPAGGPVQLFPGPLISQSSWIVPARGQLSKLGSELFPNVTEAGWVEVTSTIPGLQGFWVGGDFATYTDGADAATAATDEIFPLIAGQTEINIANISRGGSGLTGSGSTVTFRLLGANGTELATPKMVGILSRGAYQAQASALFPNADLSDAMYIRVTATLPFAGTSVVRGFLVDTESAVLNALDPTLGGNTLNFVHVVSGSLEGANYTTIVGVINLASSTQTVTLTFNPEPSGTPVIVQRSLPAKGAIRESVRSLFGFSSIFRSGWIQVSASSPIAGFVAYADMSSGGLAAVPAQLTPQSSLLFGHIAGLPIWYTGLALLNTTTTDANVEVFAMSPGGMLIAGAANVPTATFTLPAGRKSARLLSELIPATASENGGFVYVRTTNNVPLYGMELFGSNRAPILSNVAANKLVAGVTYTPPSPVEPVALSSLSPVRAARGSTITLNGGGFKYPASNNKVVFTAATGPIEVVPVTVTRTFLTAVVPATAISGPVLVRSEGQNSSAMILEVTATETTMIQSPVTVIGGEITENADIYVPRPAGRLSIASIGVANVGARNIRVGPFSPDLPRGQTRILAIVGLGISVAARSRVTISGSGVSVFDSIPFENGVLVTVNVDSAAAVGPRTVFVTNANLDTASLPGGVYIR
ncbi:MAG TPA: hypothetical protein VE422_22305 [Terriglobia bacterium]|nr:hypothetical protein [Terriglobia bacterium]